MDIEELKAYMKSKGVSQIELAERSGVPLSTIRSIFARITVNPRKDTMQAIYKALGLSEGGEEFTVPKEILDKYEALSEQDKQRVIGYLEALIEKYKKG